MARPRHRGERAEERRRGQEVSPARVRRRANRMNGSFTLLLAAFAFTGVACTKRSDCPDQAATPKAAASIKAPTVAPSALSVKPPEGPPGSLRFIAIGGGPTPESTEVSLEQ